LKALVFSPTIPRFAVTKALSILRRNASWGRLSPLRLIDIPEPPLPRGDWVRVQVRLGGICGSDLHTINLDTSPALSALTSFPFVLGHENVGTIAETGRDTPALRAGQRVTVEPPLPCEARGVAPPCAYCAAGDYHLCLRYTEGHLSPGLMIGACRDTGGSWGTSFVAHRSQVLPLHDEVADENALLAEPMACTLHAVLRHPPASGSTVLVIGGGAIGQCAIASLRAAGSNARVIALVKHPFQGEMARRLGADEVVRLGRGDAHYDAIARLTGATLRKPMLGKRIMLGGVDTTMECVGAGRSIDDALRLTHPGGSVILLGLASMPRGIDWTPIWLKELKVTGSYIYGVENWQGRKVRTMELVLEWMRDGKVDLSPLVTHRFPLDAYPKALETAMGKADSHSFKVVFEPNK
jgi:L-iditol 2-dehydrogenase